MRPELKLPKPEIVDVPWEFRVAPNIFNFAVLLKGEIQFGLIADLGFSVFRKIKGTLRGCRVRQVAEYDVLVEAYINSWMQQASPNPLLCKVYDDEFTILRYELERETLKVRGRGSLADALINEGLCEF